MRANCTPGKCPDESGHGRQGRRRYLTVRRLSLIGLCALAAAPAAIFHRESQDSSAQRAPAITLRKRLHVNPLIAEPGTMDIEWGGSFSWDGSYTLPMALRFTPEGHHAWWGRTEFSVAFDSLSSNDAVHFG